MYTISCCIVVLDQYELYFYWSSRGLFPNSLRTFQHFSWIGCNLMYCGMLGYLLGTVLNRPYIERAFRLKHNMIYSKAFG